MDPDTPQERVGALVWRLATGQKMTTRQVADLLSLKKRRARSLMLELSRVLPIFRDDDGFWKRCPVSEGSGNGLAAPCAIVDKTVTQFYCIEEKP